MDAESRLTQDAGAPAGSTILEPNNPLSQPTRRRVYEHVDRNPGRYLRQLERDLKMPLGTLEYHLHRLEETGHIVTRDFQRYKAFFPSEGLDRRERDILYFLRQEMPRRIALLVTDEPGRSFKEICEKMPVSASTAFLHMKKLVEHGIVIAERSGRRNHYYPAESERIRRLVLEYRTSFADDLVDRFAEAWFDIRYEPRPKDAEDSKPARDDLPVVRRPARRVLMPQDDRPIAHAIA